MATLEQAREILRNLVSAQVGQLNEGVFPVKLHRITAKLFDSELDDYLVVRDKFALEIESAMFSPGYYEHVIDFLNSRQVILSGIFRRDKEEIELEDKNQHIKVNIGPISARFLLAILDKSDRRQINLLRRRVFSTQRMIDRSSSEDSPHLREIFGRIFTVKVMISEEYRGKSKESNLKSIAEAALFNISYARGIGLGLSRSWERNYYRLGIRRDQDIQFPQITYNSDLLAYYHLALSSDSSILAYLSLYKILEYFYLSTSESVLHKRIRDKLISPSFSHKQATQLRELASIIRKFDQKMDEQKMLVNVIEQHFMPDEIINWINEHEAQNGQYYTTQQAILGLQHKVDLNDGQIAPSIAKRIYHVRNALVHNKEGDLPRFIPFTSQDDTLNKELPLILHLAETLIIKTGSDI